MDDRQFALVFFLLTGLGLGSVVTALIGQFVDVLLVGIMSMGMLMALTVYVVGSRRLPRNE